ncbi:hypothetical protein MMC20_007181 [Loxospora ochrophaea]|nr:hypothetical protein [Loxospora ochrophaea]
MSSLDASKLFDMSGHVVVVTGGGSGIGLMMAKALEANGAKVYIIGRRLETLQAAAKQAKNNNIIPLQGDCTSKESLTSIVSTIRSQSSVVNTLIVNHGITGPPIPNNDIPFADFQAKLWDTDAESFTQALAVNTTAAFLTTVAFLPLLDEANKKGNLLPFKSSVVTTTSIASFNRRPLAGFAYGASKAGTTHMMKSLATMLAPYQIRCNVLAPGLYPSEMTAKMFEGKPDPTTDGSFPMEQIPATRVGSEEDMAGAILYLCSRVGAYVNGNVLVTDGGRLAVCPSAY